MISDEQLANLMGGVELGETQDASHAAIALPDARALIEEVRNLRAQRDAHALTVHRVNHPRVVNLKPWRHVELPADVKRVDRQTPFGNPFPLDRDAVVSVQWPRRRAMSFSVTMTRALSVALHRAWLTEKLVAEPRFLEPLAGFRLACHCDPLLCHATNIAELQEDHRG